MKSQIRLNILPLYRCNQKCATCLFSCSDDKKETLDLSWLDKALGNLNREFEICQILLQGGEVSLLSDLYFEMLYQICKIYCKKIYVETNFIHAKRAILNNFDVINVKYDFDFVTPSKFNVFNNIKAAVSANKIINIKTLDICCQKDKTSIIEQLNSLKIKSWEIIPYHQTEHLNFKFKDYQYFENTVNEYLNLASSMKFAFQNKLQINNVLPIDNYNIKTVYITPYNKYALQNFDDKNNFFLEETDNFGLFLEKIKEMEKKRDIFCKNCTSKLQCMANRYLNLNYKGLSCSGFKNLIEANR